MQNLSYTYDEYLICIGLGPSISSVIYKNPSYSGPSYPSSPVIETLAHGYSSESTMQNIYTEYLYDKGKMIGLSLWHWEG